MSGPQVVLRVLPGRAGRFGEYGYGEFPATLKNSWARPFAGSGRKLAPRDSVIVGKGAAVVDAACAFQAVVATAPVAQAVAGLALNDRWPWVPRAGRSNQSAREGRVVSRWAWPVRSTVFRAGRSTRVLGKCSFCWLGRRRQRVLGLAEG